MSRPFDRRHRWGEAVMSGSIVSRTCLACGRVDSQETLIAISVIDRLVRYVTAPNPYRNLCR